MNTIGKKAAGRLSQLYRFWLLFVLVFVSVIFGILRPEFFSPKNLLNILSSACLSSMVGIGLTCIMSSGEIDFSCGTQITTGATAMALLMTKFNVGSYGIAIAVTSPCTLPRSR